jgi:outer membrane protein assembly factor BamB
MMTAHALLARHCRLLAATFILLASAGCSLFGTSRPDPPPYPATSDDRAYQPLWTAGSLGKALPGFSPAVTGDSIWVASADGTVSKLSRRTGAVETRFELKQKLAAGVGSDGTMVVVVSRDGDVIALDESGRRRWSVPLKGEVITAPLVAESAVLVRTVDGRIVALDRAGGSVKWNFQRTMPTLVLRQSSPMVLSDDTVFVGMPGARVMALDLRLGAPRWETVIATPRGATELERLVDIAGAPVVASGQICAVAYQGKLACLRTDDGRIIWSRDIASSSGLAVAGETVVTVDGSDVIQALKPTGDASWKQDGFVRRGVTAPVIVDGRVLFGDRYGSLSVLSLADGSPLARLTPGRSAPASAPVVVGDMVYVQTLAGAVVALPIR